MASGSEATDMQSVLERLINSRNRDLSLFIPFLLGFTSAESETGQPGSNQDQNSADSDQNSGNNPSRRERIIIINPLTQGMVVIEGTGLESLFHAGVRIKDGQPPASKSSIEAMPSVKIGAEEEEHGECAICLEEWIVGGIVKEMPCKHKFHGGCIDKWLGLHGSCPVCRFNMPVEEDEDGGKKREEEEDRRRAQREIWVSFSFGSNGDSNRGRTEEGDFDFGDHSAFDGENNQNPEV